MISTSSPNYRWVVLAVGAGGAATFAALRMGLPAFAPAIRDTFGLTLSQVGLVLSAVAAGAVATLIGWGILSDRIGERPVMAAGLAGCSLALVGAAFVETLLGLVLCLVVAGMFGASASGASGRAVMGWFGRDQRGLALGVRQMALPLGGAAAALAAPWLLDLGGLQAAFLALAGVSLGGAVLAGTLIRDPADPSGPPIPQPKRPPPVRDHRLWRLSLGGALLVSAQSVMLAFVVLFLHDERGLSAAAAAAGLAVIQIVGGVMRVVAGHRSDREGVRIAPLRRIAVRNALLIAAVGVLASGPGLLLYPLLLVAATSAMSWNGLAVTAAGEIAGRARAATAMSMQTTSYSITSMVTPVTFGGLVEATSWNAAFIAAAIVPGLAFFVLRPLQGEERERLRARSVRLREAAELSGAPALEASS